MQKPTQMEEKESKQKEENRLLSALIFYFLGMMTCVYPSSPSPFITTGVASPSMKM
jgi:hypothetical protein